LKESVVDVGKFADFMRFATYSSSSLY
jgi:hypothetical protein